MTAVGVGPGRRRRGETPAPDREPPVMPELLHADPAQWAQQLSAPRDAGRDNPGLDEHSELAKRCQTA